MFTAATVVPIIIEIVCGAAGGVAVGWLAALIPGVGGFVGHVEQAADATTQSMGALTPAVLVGVGIAGLLGGILLTAFIRVVRK